MKHSLNLLENAIDSLREAIRKFDEGQSGDHAAYKFAVLHLSHFLELLFKYHVTQAHPLLVYKNPFSKAIEKENTIGLWEAVQFLRNEGKEISPDFNRDLEWLKKLRNQIEHFKFEMDVSEVRRTLGRILRATAEFSDEFEVAGFDFKSLKERLTLPEVQSLEVLLDEYRSEVSSAQADAREASEDNKGHDCPWCGEKGTAAKDGDTLVCKFCSTTVDLYECSQCGATVNEYDAITWNDDNPEAVDYICEACHFRIMGSD
jgi:DNA-directed RNA polymerase subunit RPC12/RpoP